MPPQLGRTSKPARLLKEYSKMVSPHTVSHMPSNPRSYATRHRLQTNILRLAKFDKNSCEFHICRRQMKLDALFSSNHSDPNHLRSSSAQGRFAPRTPKTNR